MCFNDDFYNFAISIGCDTISLLRKYCCIVVEKIIPLRNFLNKVHREFDFYRKHCIMNEGETLKFTASMNWRCRCGRYTIFKETNCTESVRI